MRKLFLLLFIAAIATTNVYSQSTDEAAIKALLEKESATWRSGDVRAHADCWVIKPYSRILISTGNGDALDLPPEMMINPPAGMIGEGGTSANTNYRMNVNEKNAWVSHDEVSTAKDGKKSYSYEFRILEKIDGHWKLVGQSIHIYKPK